MKYCLYVLGVLLLCSFIASAQPDPVPITESFAWDAPDSEYSLTYLVCHSITSGVYDTIDCVDVGAVTTYSWTRILGAGRHYFTVRAVAVVDELPVIGRLSNELSLSLLPPTGGAAKVRP
jgi:hypothetical protein